MPLHFATIPTAATTKSCSAGTADNDLSARLQGLKVETEWAKGMFLCHVHRFCQIEGYIALSHCARSLWQFAPTLFLNYNSDRINSQFDCTLRCL
jgi:hypothetical protein